MAGRESCEAEVGECLATDCYHLTVTLTCLMSSLSSRLVPRTLAILSHVEGGSCPPMPGMRATGWQGLRHFE